jgi:hypothetical protein
VGRLGTSNAHIAAEGFRTGVSFAIFRPGYLTNEMLVLTPFGQKVLLETVDGHAILNFVVCLLRGRETRGCALLVLDEG